MSRTMSQKTSQKGAQKRPKIVAGIKQMIQRTCFLSIFVTNAVFLAFFVEFSSFFTEKNIEKNIDFFTPALLVFNLATLTKHRILQVRSYFFIFWVFAFFGKTLTKSDYKIRSWKIIEKMTQLGPKMIPKLIKSQLENPENHQNVQKK